MNLKLLFVLCLAAALLCDVDAGSRDKKRKKQRNDDENEEDTTGAGSSLLEKDKEKEKHEREREHQLEKEKKEKEEESSEEEDEDKKEKNGTEVEIAKRFRRQQKKKEESSDSDEDDCCDDKLKKASELNEGKQTKLDKAPTQTGYRFKRHTKRETATEEDGLHTMTRTKEVNDGERIPLAVRPNLTDEQESRQKREIATEDGELYTPVITHEEDYINDTDTKSPSSPQKRDHHHELKKTQEVNDGKQTPVEKRPSKSTSDKMRFRRSDANKQEHAHVQPRKGLAANPDNHYNQEQRAEHPPPKAHTHARQGHAANPDNHQ